MVKMFKKLREKITEEVQQTSLRLPASVQQSVQQLTQVDMETRPDICLTVCRVDGCQRSVCFGEAVYSCLPLSVLCVYAVVIHLLKTACCDSLCEKVCCVCVCVCSVAGNKSWLSYFISSDPTLF